MPETMENLEKIRQENIITFETLMSKVNRPGIDRLIEFLRNRSDFYTAPASIKYHCAYKGGLLQHSLNVYNRLKYMLFDSGDRLWATYVEKKGITEETVIITGLLHDLCKICCYKEDLRNVKVRDPEKVKAMPESMVKKDAYGYYFWDTVQGYEFDNSIMPYGHGEKSVMIAEKFIKLKSVEQYAIRWHMGATEMENFSMRNIVAAANRQYPLCLAVQIADQEAAFMMETPREEP